MEDEKLYKICLIFSLLGLGSLFASSYLLVPEKVAISSLGEEYIGEKIQIEGTVDDLHRSDAGHIFFHVKEGDNKINAVLFSGSVKEMGISEDSIKNGDRIKITGNVKRWKGELEIVPKKITLIS